MALTHIALFGGSFDPPHLGHLHIAEKLLEYNLADEVWYLPVKEHEFGKKMSSGQQRLALLKNHVTGHHLQYQPKIKIETYQLDQSQATATHQVLDHFSAQFPDKTFSFVIGSDNLERFNQWIEWEYLLKKYPFYVYPRQGYWLKPLYPGMTALSGVEPIDDSSSAVRQRLAAGQPIADLVVPAVDQYIREQQLYVTSASVTTRTY